MTARAARWHLRLFRALLLAYPAWFRNAYRDEMEQLFLSRLARARGVRRVAALWPRVGADALWTAIALRRGRTELRAALPQRRRRAGGFDMLVQDIRHGVRHLMSTPIFTLGAVALLAVGIGANVAVFTVVDRFLLRPPPYDRPDEVVYVYQDSDDGEPSSAAFPAYRDMAEQPVFSAVAATSPAQLSWERPDGTVDATVEFTTASYLAVTGLEMVRGQWFSPHHDVVGSEPVAVVSAAAWRSRFGGDPEAVGRTIRLNGSPVTIIGVGPESLGGTFAPVVTDFWLSISAVAVGGQFRVGNLDRREDHWYSVRARLAPGVSVEQARAAMQALATRLGEMYPELDKGRGITVQRARDVRLFPETESTLALATAVVLTLLLLACANLANLLLVRGIGRSREMAIRCALGAGGVRIARLCLVESLLLSLLGGIAGLVLARVALSALPMAPLPPPFSATMDLAIDGRIGVFSIALMIVTGTLFGLAPALRAARRDVAGELREDQRVSSAGRATMRLRNGLVVVQVATSLVLVLTAGLLSRSLAATQRVDTGVDAGRVAFTRTNLARAGVSGPEAYVLLEQLRERVEALPGVTYAAAASRLPAQFSGTTTTIVEGYTPPAGTEAVELGFTVVTPQYFDTMGLRILTGRGFTSSDAAGADRVVIINQAAAQQFWGGVAPVGRRLRSQGQTGVFRTVIGVAADAPVNTYPERPIRPMFYAPAAQAGFGPVYVLARTEGDPAALSGAMRAAVTEVRSSLPVLAQGTLESHFGAALSALRFITRVMGATSALAVLLAALGIYAVVAFNVAQRAGELGIRVALGANPGRVVRMVLGEALVSVVAGLAGGLLVAALAARQLESALFGVQPLDPVTFGGGVAFLTGVAWLAAYLPARRAAMADPARALRAS
ncbi:MAG TPA: ADOP family duplicated permease [Vicinamibacterales bacterium]|nr:ADOP family duplicated permease [Vicinamibacterales bacterium]